MPVWRDKQLGWEPFKGLPSQIISPWKDPVHFDARYATFLPAPGDESWPHDSVGGQKWYLHHLHLNSWLSHDVLQLLLPHLVHSRDVPLSQSPHNPLISLFPTAAAVGWLGPRTMEGDASPLQSTRASVPLFSFHPGPHREPEVITQSLFLLLANTLYF